MHTPAVKSASDLSVASILTHAGASSKLVKLSNGRYTAASTLKSQTNAFHLGLGHTQAGAVGENASTAATSAVSSSSSAVMSALSTLPVSGF